MHAMKFVRCWGLLFVAVWALTGCESSDQSVTQTEAQPMGDHHGVVAVLPVSAFSYLPADYDFLYQMADADIRQSLEGAGISLVPAATVQAALDANNGALRRKLQSPKSSVIASGIAGLINELRNESDVTTLVMPQLLERSQVLQSPYQSATWDGVTRSFTVNGDRNSQQQLQVDSATLMISVYNRYGDAEYYGRGGVDFLENATRVGPGLYASPKQPGQIAEANVQEAVQLAMGPWQAEFFRKVGDVKRPGAY